MNHLHVPCDERNEKVIFSWFFYRSGAGIEFTGFPDG